MNYIHLNQRSYAVGPYKITTIRREDMLAIKQWRNEQIDVLRQSKPLTDEEQLRYYTEVVEPSFTDEKTRIMLFSYFWNDEFIGYGGLTNLDWVNKRAEISYLVQTERSNPSNVEQYTEDFSSFLTLMKRIAFTEIGLNRLFTEAYDIRPLLIQILEDNGFVPEGRMKEHVLIRGKYVDSLLHGYLREYYVEEDHKEKTDGSVLVTSVSKKVPLLNCLKKSIEKLGQPLSIVGADCNSRAIGRYFTDSFWEMPYLSELSFEQLLAYCKEHNIQYIVPTRDGELKFLAHCKSELRNHGIHVMVSDLEGVEACVDKLLFYQKGQQLGSPVVPTYENILDLKTDRWVAKERFGAGSESIGLNLSKEEALSHANRLRQPIFQPYIEGNEVSVDVYIQKNGTCKGTVARIRELVVNGESQITTTLRNEKLERICASFAEQLGLYGHVIFQVMIDVDGVFHFIECNSRFGGASRLSVEAGLDSFYWFLLESQGEDISEYPFIRSAKDKKLVRYVEDLIE
ncbi:carbamoyl phosphate synthase-like protein [compost metagenome]